LYFFWVKKSNHLIVEQYLKEISHYPFFLGALEAKFRSSRALANGRRNVP
jgi:hypothetical protein